MRKVWKIGSAVSCVLAVAVVLLVAGVDRAQARPKYFAAFVEKYPKVAENYDFKKKNKKTRCNACHFGKKKKNRNPYGEAVQKHVGKKNQKDAEKIAAALDEAAKQKSETEGKTFGDVLEDGKLPYSLDWEEDDDS